MHAPAPVVIGRTLELRCVHAVARQHAAVSLAPEARDSLLRTRTHLEAALARGETIYGVNTGFGALSDTRIAAGELGVLQRNLLRSHAVGVGPALSGEIVRALLLLRAHTLALGASGVTPELAEFLLTMLACDVRPIVPCQGSVGASGDLAPLAHLALVLIGEGDAWFDGHVLPARDALAAAGLTPRQLGPKEGLSLINGTQVMTAIGALALVDAAELVTAADVIGALSLDALLGTTAASDPRSTPASPTRASAAPPRSCACCSPTRRSTTRTATAARSRTPTACAACRRSTGPCAARSPTSPRPCASRSTASPTTPSCSRATTAATTSSAAATSTATPSPCRSTT
jgi:histidine ammonia-lyase